jgi:hypothetical protein
MKYGEFISNPQERVQMLVDRQWFLGDNLLSKVYPRSPLQLFYDYIENKYADSNQIKPTSMTSWIDLKKIFSDTITTIFIEFIKKFFFSS